MERMTFKELTEKVERAETKDEILQLMKQYKANNDIIDIVESSKTLNDRIKDGMCKLAERESEYIKTKPSVIKGL